MPIVHNSNSDRRSNLLMYGGIGFLSVVMVAGVAMFGESGNARHERLSSKPIETRMLFETLRPHPPIEATLYGVRTERERSYKQIGFEIEQEYSVRGRFADVADYYGRLLTAGGWRVVEASRAEDGGIEYCRTPYLFYLQRSASSEAESPPHHRLLLQLTWQDKFTGARCPLS